jgi:hypothetical protein
MEELEGVTKEVQVALEYAASVPPVWTCSQVGFVKQNWDADLNKDMRQMGIGLVVRDD